MYVRFLERRGYRIAEDFANSRLQNLRTRAKRVIQIETKQTIPEDQLRIATGKKVFRTLVQGVVDTLAGLRNGSCSR